MTAEELMEGFSAFSGRLQITPDKKEGEYRLEYCIGQYWPTEYRAAACAVLAQAIWVYYRKDLVDFRDVLSLRATFKRIFGSGMQKRWFN
jgi:hypothetical protein